MILILIFIDIFVFYVSYQISFILDTNQHQIYNPKYIVCTFLIKLLNWPDLLLLIEVLIFLLDKTKLFLMA